MWFIFSLIGQFCSQQQTWKTCRVSFLLQRIVWLNQRFNRLPATLDSSNTYGAKLCRELHSLCAVDPGTKLGWLVCLLVEGCRGLGVWYQDLEVLHDTSKGVKNYWVRAEIIKSWNICDLAETHIKDDNWDSIETIILKIQITLKISRAPIHTFIIHHDPPPHCCPILWKWPPRWLPWKTLKLQDTKTFFCFEVVQKENDRAGKL